MDKTCETCRFEDERECRRLPPRWRVHLFIYGIGWSSAAFPKIDMDDWCGEHQPKDHPHD